MSYHPAEATAPSRLGRYELIGQLATGGMAEIHLARLAGEAGFEKIVVVKRLLPELVASRAFVAMFLDEGKLVARLDHPNICEVHELGRDGAEYFLVMPYLDGVPVTELIARPRDDDRIAQLRVVAGVIAQACAGLHHAHELRAPDGTALALVHRDVSPSNLFVTTAGVVKVLDFGVAKVLGGAETEAGTIKGKTQYMAPEQLLGEPLDRRCDIFALGIVLFELATHERLFKRSSDYLSARAILEEPIPRADAVDPAVPTELAVVIAQALERSRDARFADARALGRALEVAMAPHRGLANADEIAASLSQQHGEELDAQRTRQARILSVARSRGATDRSSLATTPRSLPRRRASLALVVAAVAVVTAGVITLVAVRGSDAPDSRIRGSDTAVRGSDAPDNRVRGPDTVDTGVRGSDAPDNRVRGSDAPDIRVRGSDAPDNRVRGSDAPDNRVRGSDAPDDRVRGSDNGVRGSDAPDTADEVDMPATTIRRTGRVSIDSTPYATIFVDGRELGVTPLVHKPLGAGRHRVRAVLQDGRTRELDIDVPAGGAAKPITLSW